MASDISIGTLLADRYEILSEIGRGRVGIVYKAVHKHLEKLVAVKVLFDTVSGDETAMKRFEHEARSTAGLNHPNIIGVLDYGSSRAGFAYLVMEFIEGSDLQDTITKESRISLNRSVKIITQVAGALAHAHNRGIIHRDLKPSNIMLVDFENYPDFVKLVDFGIAKRYDGNELNLERLTADGQVLGTPAYMSPEQCSAGKLDARSDIYSLGCVMFKMMTGVPPIGGSSIIDIIQNHVSQEPLSFAEACADIRVPPAIQEVVMTALTKDPRKRHQTMLEFSNLLNAAMTQVAGGNATPSSPFRMGEGIAQQRVSGIFTLPPSMQQSGSNMTAPARLNAPSPPSGPNAPTTPQSTPAINAPQQDDGRIHGRKFETVMEAAQAGDPRSQYEVAVRLSLGEGVDSNVTEANRWLRAAAQSGHKEAQYRLGKLLMEGDGASSPAPFEGFTFLLKSAEQGYEPALVTVATCYEEGRGTKPDMLRAAQYYRAAVKQGNVHAKPKLSLLYERCLAAGMMPDGFDEWLEERAIDGDVDALYTIAVHRKGSTSLSRRAVGQLLPAAETGHFKAQMALAHVYLTGKQPDDARQAFYWLSKAAAGGEGEALLSLACATKSGIGCPKDPAKAIALLHQAADQQHVQDAAALLGAALLIGDGVPRNLTRGIAYLKSAAAAGNSLAAWKLALCVKNGLGAVRDTKEAEKWFDKAAEGKFDQGPPWQWSVQQLQFSEVIQTFQGLAAVEHRQAHYWLGICYEHGVGLPRDINKALEFYTKSANKGFQPALDAANRVKQQRMSVV